MSMLKAPRKVSARQELRQDVVVTGYAKLIQTFEQNRTLFIGAGAIVVLALILLIGYFFYQSSREDQAKELLGGVIALYENGQYRQALDGPSIDQPGLLEIANSYGGTADGNLAAYCAADAFYRLGDYEQALTYFEKFDGEGQLAASAHAGAAAIYEDRQEYERAADLYARAARAFDSTITTPLYYHNAGRNYLAARNWDRARTMYETLKEDYETSQYGRDADLYLAQIEAMQ